jgi:all-trans-retinol dehydrogenase (NAD+)
MWLYVFAAATASALYFWWARRRRVAALLAAAGSLRGKTVVVTGGGSGIGAALVEKLAVEEGADVYVCDVDATGAAVDTSSCPFPLTCVPGLSNVRSAVEAKGALITVFPLDVANRKQVTEMVEMLEQRGKPIEVLVNNAGVAFSKPFLETTDEQCEKTFRVNVFAHWYAIRACLPSMLRRRSGHIVNVGSLMDSLATPNLAAYTASKWAVTGFTESLREEMAAIDARVDVTLIRPWVVATPLFSHLRFWR